MNPTNQICDWSQCNNLGKISCTRCGDAWYCSRSHQRQNWGDHYHECRSYKIEHTDEAGNCLLASTRIKAGQRILIDEPLAVGPLMSSELICLTCHLPIEDDDFNTCPDCHWPMCSSKCYSSAKHDVECNILSQDTERWAVPTTQGITPRYDLILIIRCLLLRERDPKSWSIILSMASHDEKMKQVRDPYHMTAVRFLSEVWDFPADIVHRVRGAIACNAFEIRGPGGNKIRALYPNIRLFNHSCIPNVHLASGLDYQMEAKSAIDINKNDELTLSYPGTAQPIWERRKFLSNIHYFHCMCRRCSDPTELGTYFSSPRCPKCRLQFLTPHSESMSWKCQKCKTECDIPEMEQEIDDWLFRLDMNELFGTGRPCRIANGLAQIEREFHLQHFIYLKASQAALHKLKNNNSWAALRLKRHIWENTLKLFNTLEPGLSRRRGMILVELGNVLSAMAEVGAEDEEFSKAQLENYQKEAKLVYVEAFEILHTEPKETLEAELALVIQKKIYQLP